MAASTTLMTFMVRTPVTTRAVDLYGSWDNFTTPYPMARDVRLGAEHWSGCHSFENIICDGIVDGNGFRRQGGLKMGGTYWYYYKLDDEIEFHNSGEPATTRCPLLPGQLVNILQVPVALSGARKRDASISSTSSERRTLDPEAKFMNPRPVPTPPKLGRLRTSPDALQPTLTSSGQHVEPASAGPLLQMNIDEHLRAPPARVFHLPRKSSLGSLFKTANTKHNPAGLRQVFKPTDAENSTHQDRKYQEIVDWIPTRHMEPQIMEPAKLAPKFPPGALLLRSHSDEVPTLASFREHRRQRSRSNTRHEPDDSQQLAEGVSNLELNPRRVVEQGPLSVLLEVNSPDGTPACGPMTARRNALEALEGRNESPPYLGKRLPTLPNTPSSVYPLTAHGSPPRDTTALGSHFSTTTIDTVRQIDSVIIDDGHHSQFLGFDQTSSISPLSNSSSIDDSAGSPVSPQACVAPALRPLSLDATISFQDSADNEHGQPRIFSSSISFQTISSTVSTTPTTSYGESDSTSANAFLEPHQHRSSESPMRNIQHYKLPEAENLSEVTLKRYDSDDYSTVSRDSSGQDRHQSQVSHSEGMQQLLDELSYLSAMIQN